MKQLLLLLSFLLLGTNAEAQFLNFGVKGGVNYNANGDLRAFDGNNYLRIPSSEESGYHLGLLAEIKLPLWMYLRPELQYTHTESSYSVEGNSSKLKMDKIEAPVLLGFRVLKIGRVFFGPNFQYLVNTDLTDTSVLQDVRDLSSDDLSVAGQFGIGLNLGKFGLDLRWETGFTDSEANFIGEIVGEDAQAALQVNTKPQQFIFSLYYKFK